MPIKVCFISLRSYPLFVRQSLDYFGGAEVQISLIAKALAKDKRFAVSIIVGDYGQKAVIQADNIRLYKTRKFDFLKVLKHVAADIYIERTVNPKIFIAAAWCRLFKKKLIYMVAHDWDCAYQRLRLVDAVICQSFDQQKLLLRKLRLTSQVMYPLVTPYAFKPARRKFYLWVGRADNWKRPQEFIRLAQQNPSEKFVMICRPGNFRFSPPILPNLQFIPAVAPEEIGKFFSRAKALINTSVAEGWPNTFLQAGAAKTPALSFRVNPDHYLTRFHCGSVKPKLSKPGQNAGLNHYQYVKKFHSAANLKVLKSTLCRL